MRWQLDYWPQGSVASDDPAAYQDAPSEGVTFLHLFVGPEHIRFSGYDNYAITVEDGAAVITVWSDPGQPWASRRRVGGQYVVRGDRYLWADLAELPVLPREFIKRGVMVPDVIWAELERA